MKTLHLQQCYTTIDSDLSSIIRARAFHSRMLMPHTARMLESFIYADLGVISAPRNLAPLAIRSPLRR